MGVKPVPPSRVVKSWDDETMHTWARKVCGRPKWRLCGLSLGVLRLMRELDVMTRLAENLALERDQLRQKLESK